MTTTSTVRSACRRPPPSPMDAGLDCRCLSTSRPRAELKGHRGQMMAQKIQARLDRSGFEFPDKPRGMHWRSYVRGGSVSVKGRSPPPAAIGSDYGCKPAARRRRSASLLTRAIAALAHPEHVRLRSSHQEAKSCRLDVALAAEHVAVLRARYLRNVTFSAAHRTRRSRGSPGAT
jgi:hypothetical protein